MEGVLRAKGFKGEYKTKAKFPGGRVSKLKKDLPWEGMDIFWNNKMHLKFLIIKWNITRVIPTPIQLSPEHEE